MSEQQQQVAPAQGDQAAPPAVPAKKKEYPVLIPEFGMTVMELAGTLAKSGMFGKALSPEQALAKILLGREMGMPPVTALQNIDVFDGHIFIRSNWRASLIKERPGYDFVIQEHDNTKCVIEYFRGGDSIGISRYTIEDATRAGLMGKDNWKHHPKNMLFNRAMSNGQKWFCPEIMNGLPTYDPDEREEIINANFTEVNPAPATAGGVVPVRQTAQIRDMLRAKAESAVAPPAETQAPAQQANDAPAPADDDEEPEVPDIDDPLKDDAAGDGDPSLFPG